VSCGSHISANRWRELRMRCNRRATRITAPGLVLATVSFAMPANAMTLERAGGRPIVLAQAMIPRTGMMDAQNPMPMKERYLKLLSATRASRRSDWQASTRPAFQDTRLRSEGGAYSRRRDRVYRRLQSMVGMVRAASCGAARSARYRRRPLGVARYVTSDCDAAPTWHDTAATSLPADATVRVALSRS
jgi:hypothetical protein